jgi:putative DNA primase/helicase
MIELAQHYARQGWPVFPLVAGGKVPLIARDRGGRGCHDATLDLNRIEHWWIQEPQANIGIATGGRSSLLVIDVDVKDGRDGINSVQALETPRTFTVRTASGGYHLYFLMPPDAPVSIGQGLLPGVDWRGTGGYVLAAGSIVNGSPYCIVRNKPIEPAPASLLQRLEQAQRKAKVIARDEAGRMVIPNGSRNEQMFRMACALRRFGVERAALLESLFAISSEHCTPSLGSDELEQITESAMRYLPAESHEVNH